MSTSPINLLNLNTAELTGLLAKWGEPVYRVKQIQHWLFRDFASSFDEMTNLPQPLRARLHDETTLGVLPTVTSQASADGLTHKALLQLPDGQTVETVLMSYLDAPGSPENATDPPQVSRRTVCISTQVGCPIGCPFCETGQAGYIRNLTVAEIVAQVLHFARQQKNAGYTNMPLTNIVVMGMGEPLMKFDVTWAALQALTDPARFGMGDRRITVSTSGLIPGIHQLIAKKSQVNLAISLHAPDDKLRDVLVPINRKYPLTDLMQACRDYVRHSHRRLTFEYALMDQINDSPAQAQATARLLKGILSHVNLIPLNPTSASPYRRTPYIRVQEFERVLRQAGVPTTLRVEKGIEIAAGCGQLRQQVARQRAAKVNRLPLAG